MAHRECGEKEGEEEAPHGCGLLLTLKASVRGSQGFGGCWDSCSTVEVSVAAGAPWGLFIPAETACL